MNRRWLAGLLAAALICCGVPNRAAGEEAPVCQAIYLRVVARDDSPEAQAEKLRLRDAVRAACPARCADPQALLPLIQSIAAPFAPCRVDLRPWTPGGGVPPAPTVYILLGEGAGHNWWGILYPNALLWARLEEEPTDRDEPKETDAAEQSKPNGEDAASPAHPNEEPPPPRQVEFVWPILAWIRGLLGL